MFIEELCLCDGVMGYLCLLVEVLCGCDVIICWFVLDFGDFDFVLIGILVWVVYFLLLVCVFVRFYGLCIK